jgi:voltage-gated potassium channel
VTPDETPPDDTARERDELLERVCNWMEPPLILLGFVWLILLVIDFTRGLSTFLQLVSNAIWVTFILAFLIELTLARSKLAYLRRNWLTALSLALPALRIFRIFRAVRVLRAARAVRGARLVRVVSSLNRGTRALGRVMARRGVGYVALLTTLVTVGGAAAMYAFENGLPGSRINDFGSALWWTSMIMTTLGSEYWPQSAEGRLLCILLALYAFGVFGYITATLASFFVDRDAEAPDTPIADAASIEELRVEIVALRADVQALRAAHEGPR